MASGYESITVSTSSIGITATLIDTGENYAFITVEDATIRYRLDGTAPTTSEGHMAVAGSSITLWDDEVSRFRAIRDDASDAVLKVSVGIRSEYSA